MGWTKPGPVGGAKSPSLYPNRREWSQPLNWSNGTLRAGIYLGHGYAVPVTAGVKERVIKRIVRGLYWHHFNNSLSADIHVSLTFIDKRRPQWQETLSSFLTLGRVVIGDGQTFQYFCGQSVLAKVCDHGTALSALAAVELIVRDVS